MPTARYSLDWLLQFFCWTFYIRALHIPSYGDCIQAYLDLKIQIILVVVPDEGISPRLRPLLSMARLMPRPRQESKLFLRWGTEYISETMEHHLW